MPGKIVTLSPKVIVVTGLQVRKEMNRAHAEEIAEQFDEDNPTWPDGLPPVTVFFDGKTYFLADGHHRLDAAVQSGCTEIRVDVRKGTMNDALLFACGANASHGLKRSNEDKRNAVRIAHQLNPGNTDRAIAKLCKVSNDLANRILRELRAGGKKTSPAKPEKETTEVRVFSDTDNGGSKLSEPENDAVSVDVAESPKISPETIRPVVPLEPEFAKIDSLLREASSLIDLVGKTPGGEMLRSNHLKLRVGKQNGESVEKLYSTDLENLQRELKHWRPHSPKCPVCDGIPSQSCNLCLGLPYLTRGAFDRLTEEQRAKLETPRDDAA